MKKKWKKKVLSRHFFEKVFCLKLGKKKTPSFGKRFFLKQKGLCATKSKRFFIKYNGNGNGNAQSALHRKLQGAHSFQVLFAIYCT